MLNLEGPGLQNDETGSIEKIEENEEIIPEKQHIFKHSIPEKEEQLLKHLNNNKQILHWFVSNIPTSKSINDGKILFNYIQPMPYYGTGYHRFVFILFRHRELINFEKYFLNK
jgi:hypothetical protein